jgi:hypothetical protein
MVPGTVTPPDDELLLELEDELLELLDDELEELDELLELDEAPYPIAINKYFGPLCDAKAA